MNYLMLVLTVGRGVVDAGIDFVVSRGKKATTCRQHVTWLSSSLCVLHSPSHGGSLSEVVAVLMHNTPL